MRLPSLRERSGESAGGVGGANVGLVGHAPFIAQNVMAVTSLGRGLPYSDRPREQEGACKFRHHGRCIASAVETPLVCLRGRVRTSWLRPSPGKSSPDFTLPAPGERPALLPRCGF